MKEILTNEEQLDDLQAILDEYSGNLTKIKERIAHLFAGHSLPASPKLEAVYRENITAVELLHALYPKSTIETKSTLKWHDLLEPKMSDIPPTTDINELIAGEMNYEDKCSRFLTEVYYGNAHLINSVTLQALAKFLHRHKEFCPANLDQEIASIADHLFKKYCGDDGDWIDKKTGPKEKTSSTDEQIFENQIVQDFYSAKGGWQERQNIVADRHSIKNSKVAHVVAAYNNKLKIQAAHDLYTSGTISLKQFYDKIKKPAALDKKREIKIDGKTKS